MIFSELQIQEKIWQSREKWSDLISDLDLSEFENANFIENPELAFNPNVILSSLVKKRISEIYDSAKAIHLISIELHLQKEGIQNPMRMDFFGSLRESPGVAIIELKKDKQTERQAFTELLGYSNYIREYFPTIAKDDIIYVLITPMDTQIAKNAYLHSLLFDHRRIICLKPEFEDIVDLDTLRLKPYIPNLSDLIALKKDVFKFECFSGVLFTWNDLPEWTNLLQFKEFRNGEQRCNTAVSYVAQEMEKQGIHGFVYSFINEVNKSNFIFMAGINPFVAGFNLHSADIENNRNVNFKDFFKGIEKRSDHNDCGFFSNQDLTWMSHFGDISFKSLRHLFKNHNKLEFNSEFEHYRDVSHYLFNSTNEQNALFFNCNPTGIIRELYYESLNAVYTNFDPDFIIENLRIPYFVDALNDKNTFMKFIRRFSGMSPNESALDSIRQNFSQNRGSTVFHVVDDETGEEYDVNSLDEIMRLFDSTDDDDIFDD